MRIGVIVPQGWLGDFDGWEPSRAWARVVEVARQAEGLGFDSVWVVDHLHTSPELKDEIMFESFTALTALATQTSRVQIGQLVMAAAWRNPALVAKMISTLDVVSGGRVVLGMGAGWKRDEWEAYGFGFPTDKERLSILRDHLAVIEAMLGPGRAYVETPSITVREAVNIPVGLQKPRVPVLVGGNGPIVTWRLAARYADELNLDGLSPEQVAEALPVIAARCEEIGRDPTTLPVSNHIQAKQSQVPGDPRRRLLAAHAELGLHRVMLRIPSSATDDAAFEALAEDAMAAGLEIG